MNKPLALVTGASSGIGLELALICARQGFDLVIAADTPELDAATRCSQTPATAWAALSWTRTSTTCAT